MADSAVPVRPAVNARFHAEIIEGEAVAFVGENGSIVTHEPAALQVVALVDGVRTARQITATLAPVIDPAATHEVLGALARAGVLTEAVGAPPELTAVWAELGVSALRLAELLAYARVAVQPLANVPLDGLLNGFADLGLRVSQNGEGLRVVVVEDYLDPRLADVDRRARASGQPWLPVKPVGVNVWVGPVVVPGRTACWHCLEARLRRNRPVDDYLHRRRRRLRPLPTGRARSHAAVQQAFAMAVHMAARWFAGSPEGAPPETTLSILETLPLVVSEHAVLRRPQCAACGNPSLAVAAAGPPRLGDHPLAVVSTDGGEHVEPPEATYARFAHLVSPVTGAVTAVEPSPWNGAGPVRAYVAGHNFALAGDSLRVVAENLRSHSAGKGRTDAQARTSALCEALERLSGVHTGDEPRIVETLGGLGDAAVDPRTYLLFSERQYAERDKWLASGSRFQVVPRPFDPGRPLEWSPLWSLTEDRVRYLPTACLYYGYPYVDERFVAWADSNGAAAGVTLAQACLQGLYELIERDSVALWWYNRIRRPAVDLDAVADPWVAELREFYAARGREVWLLDLTADLGIAAFAALSNRVGAHSEDVVMGFGAHRDPTIAAARALTEMNQFMPAVLDVAPDGMTAYRIHDRDAIRWWVTADVANQPYLTPLRSHAPTRLPAAQPSGGRFDATERLAAEVAALAAHGLEVLVLDQTRPDIGLPVAKVVVPGLRHFWARFAPGRLYDVPVELGWLPEPLSETELNPIPMFL